MKYQLTQPQYARIYGSTARSIRTYQSEEAPLDEPLEMYQWLWARRTQPAGFTEKTPEAILAAYEAEADPAASAVQIQLELAGRILEARSKLWQVATFAHKYREHFERADDIVGVVKDAKCLTIIMLAMGGDPPPGNFDTWPPRSAELQEPIFDLEGFAEDLPSDHEDDDQEPAANITAPPTAGGSRAILSRKAKLH